MWIVIVIIIVIALFVLFTKQEHKADRERKNYTRSLLYEARCQLYRDDIREWIYVYLSDAIKVAKVKGVYAEYLCVLETIDTVKEAIRLGSQNLHIEYDIEVDVIQKIGNEEIAYAFLYYKNRV